jgi:parvulin-like peptidyl-prolyl isomerase
MRVPIATWRVSFAAVACLLFVSLVSAQEVIDRVVARIENDVILLSDVRLLSHYQLLVEGKAEGDAEILDRLIDQWIVRNEANVARTPQPSDPDIDRAVQRLIQGFSSKEDFEARRKLAGLSEADVRRVTTDQLFLNSYLDSRFRPTVQVEEQQIQDFYKNALIPRAQARGTTPPTFDAAHDFIQEALIQRGINEQADRWLKESHARLRVSKMLQESRP